MGGWGDQSQGKSIESCSVVNDVVKRAFCTRWTWELSVRMDAGHKEETEGLEVDPHT